MKKSCADYRISLDVGDLVAGHKSAVDVMFESLAKCVGTNCVAVLLTGMGKDGANGMLSLKTAGAMTYAQDEQSCIVYEMPKTAVELGGVDKVVGLDDMAQSLATAVKQLGEKSNFSS